MGLVTPEAAADRMTQIHEFIVSLPSVQTPETAAGAMASLALLGFQ